MSTITPLPDPPLRSSPNDFATKGDAFMAALPDFVTETNIVASEVNSNASAASSSASAASVSASAASSSESAAEAYADIAASATDYQGAWSAGTYTIGQTVSHNSGYWIVAVASTNDEPSSSSADWFLIKSSVASIKSASLHFLTNR